jgi:hypothetical protein
MPSGGKPCRGEARESTGRFGGGAFSLPPRGNNSLALCRQLYVTLQRDTDNLSIGFIGGEIKSLLQFRRISSTLSWSVTPHCHLNEDMFCFKAMIPGG